MYARYVPPPKNPRAPGPSPPAAVNRAAATPDAIKPNLVEQFSYARYVPPSKTLKSPASVNSENKSIHFFEEKASPLGLKRKRDLVSESHKSEAKKLGKKLKHHSATNGDSVKEEPEPSSVRSEEKRKNRRKRKHRTRTAEDSSDDPEEHRPKKPIPSRQLQQDDKVEKPELESESEPELEPEKQNTTTKKVLKKVKGADDNKDPDGDGDVDVDEISSAHTTSREVKPSRKERKPKKDKEKKKSKKKATKDEPEERDEEADKEQERHKLILARKSKSIQLAANEPSHAAADERDSDYEQVEPHDLEPLPQPPVVPDDETKPTYETLPSWLSAPIRVSQDKRAPFAELGIDHRPSRILGERGFPEAFAVQTAVIPLLLPTSQQRPGDVLVSAATGSGKTLAYALPIVRDISGGIVTRLRALVVLPTRELVRQAQQVFEMCAKACDGEDRKRVRIGIAVGSQSIKSEQEALMERDSRYDPDAYQRILNENVQRGSSSDYANDAGDADVTAAACQDPRLGAWKGEVVDFSSKVDVLICTPGRLVEHLEQSAGFSLDYVRWLVVDEADKLLAQSFQGWLHLISEKFQTSKFSARDFPDMAYSGVRKVILSATLTRDLSMLNQLSLRRPRLVVLESEEASAQVAQHTLPVTLREFAVRVHHTDLKPLYLLDLLRGPHMKQSEPDMGDADHDTEPEPVASGGGSGASPGDSDSSDSDSSASTSSGSASSSNQRRASATPPRPPLKWQPPLSLIFTKSNESALRLSRLLAILDPSLSPRLSTLTSTTATHVRRKVLRSFTTSQSPVRLIIASDLVARGVDIPKLDHVINYDLPASLAGYIHRVGRTARAGRAGCAWTLIGDDESGWFWGKIGKNQGVKRAQKVERARIDEMGQERIQEYEAALAALGKEAMEPRRKP